jgi:hydroxyacylglutathione hydrolase
LPPATQVFCAHEYTASNLKFLASVDPDGCGKVLDDVLEKRSRGVPTVPSTVGKELEYNLFMKTREKKVRPPF